MSICYATQYDIAIFSKNKWCTFYVVKSTDNEKYHVFVVVYPQENHNDQKGYIMSSHDDQITAQIQKNKYARMYKGRNFYDESCNGTRW